MTPIDKAKRLLELRSELDKYGGDTVKITISSYSEPLQKTQDFITTAANDITEILNDYLKVKRQLEKCKEQRNYEINSRSKDHDKMENKERFAAGYIKLLDAELEQVGMEEENDKIFTKTV